ncbi:pyruvate decarboxylase [Burkholderia pseudomallei]|nr:pyruvate decarboxylase [Burkholderia pseudomallei]ARK91991.1 pyruvate decarboxylase [Burkholderia pseudomallei]ARL06048.1 pyruvate decarboxylase [Burkholderia pseudomallei]ARL42730.1 pyruvate decarboxylase [Burkholderia pseudomallei]ARL89578.1 pyruvate decarboxylase [Burkholderia pseudomallei]
MPGVARRAATRSRTPCNGRIARLATRGARARNRHPTRGVRTRVDHAGEKTLASRQEEMVLRGSRAENE